MAERLHVLDWHRKARDTVFESRAVQPWELAGRSSLPPADTRPPITVPCRLAGTARAITPDELASIQQALANGTPVAQIAAKFERSVQTVVRIRKAMLAAVAAQINKEINECTKEEVPRAPAG